MKNKKFLWLIIFFSLCIYVSAKVIEKREIEFETPPTIQGEIVLTEKNISTVVQKDNPTNLGQITNIVLTSTNEYPVKVTINSAEEYVFNFDNSWSTNAVEWPTVLLEIGDSSGASLSFGGQTNGWTHQAKWVDTITLSNNVKKLLMFHRVPSGYWLGLEILDNCGGN